jgi:hypothetical protein
MVVRDHTSEVLVSACRQLHACQDGTEAELSAMEEGMKLALLWTNLPVIVETDYALALE